MVFRVGDRRSLVPGYSIFQDSSWDARGTVVLCRDADIIDFRRGNALRMGRLEIREGARIITGELAYGFLHASESELQACLG